jgi:ferredoxin
MPKLTFTQTGETFDLASGTSLLVFCQETQTPQTFGCTVGHCGACICRVTNGGENLNPPSEGELETLEQLESGEGARLGCQLEIQGDVTIAPA